MTTHARTPNSSNSKKKPRFASGTLAFATTNSKNQKIGKVATTYATQASCPNSCPFFDGGGCYAEQGPIGVFHTKPLNAAASASPAPPTPAQIAQAEADAIDALKVAPNRPLRIHTVGDCRTDEAASIVAAAAERYVKRGGGPAWTYTHAWREVTRASWGKVNVLASCETAEEVHEAHAHGYATAIVVEQFPTKKRYEVDGAAILPCPAQTKPGAKCESCQLCFKTPRLRSKKLTIGFAVHGTPLGVRKARLALRDPNNPSRKLSSRILIPRFVADFVSKNGREPTTREIANNLSLTASSVHEMRKKLRQASTVE